MVSGAERVDPDQDLEATGIGVGATGTTMGEGSSKEGEAEVTATAAAAAAVEEDSNEERGRDGGERGRRSGLCPPRFGVVAGLRPWTEGWTRQSLDAQVGFTHTAIEGGRERGEAELFTFCVCLHLIIYINVHLYSVINHKLRPGQSRATVAQGMAYFVCFFVLFSCLC